MKISTKIEKDIIISISRLNELKTEAEKKCKEYICSFVKKYGKEYISDAYYLSLYDDDNKRFYGKNTLSVSTDGYKHYVKTILIKHDCIYLYNIRGFEMVESRLVFTDIEKIAKHLMGIRGEMIENKIS